MCCAATLPARCELLGGVLEGSHALSCTQRRDQHASLQVCTGNGTLLICVLSARSPPAVLCHGPPPQPPGKGRNSQRMAQKCRLLYGFMMALSGHKQDSVLGCAKSPTGRVKAAPKCLAVKQLNFGNGFLYKLVLHLRHSQQIREHNGKRV